MGRMKDLHITIHNGGDEAVAAVERMGKDWREQLEQAASEIERTRLTDAERAAVLFCYNAALPETEKLGGNAGELCRMHRDTLRGLLERTQ